MRCSVALVMGLYFCCALSASAGVHSLLRRFSDEPAQQPHPAIVRIEVVEPGALSHGSGSLIGVEQDYGWVITNWHVVRGAQDQVSVLFPGGYKSPGVVMKTDENWDLALVAVYRPPIDPLPLADRIPVPGDPLFIAGYGQGKFRLASGECTGYAAPDSGFPQEMIDVSVPARQGDSGGPIVNAQGQLAGVLFGSGGGLTTGTHVGRLQQFLADATVNMPTSAPGPAKTELAGQPLTSLKEPNDPIGQPGSTLDKPPDPGQPPQELPSMPTLTVQAPPRTPDAAGAEAIALASAPAAQERWDPDATEVVGDIPWLNPQGPWGETQAFLAFVTLVGILLLISPRRGQREEEE